MTSDSSNEPRDEAIRVGPSYRYAVSGLVWSFTFFPGVLVAAFGYSMPFRRALFHFFSFSETVQQLIVSYYDLQKNMHLGQVGATLAILTFLRVIFRQLTTTYSMNDEYLYVVQGLFRRYNNTVAKSLIFDADISQNIFQVMFGTGNVIIRTLDHQVIVLHYVRREKDVRDAVLAHSAANHARLLGRV